MSNIFAPCIKNLETYFAILIYFEFWHLWKGPELPEPRSGHCLAYDEEDDVFFVTGGSNSAGSHSTTAWKFKDPLKFTLNSTTQMNKARYNHACGIYKHNGTKLLVVACGHKPKPQPHTCEFYDLTKADSQWKLCSKSNSLFLV